MTLCTPLHTSCWLPALLPQILPPSVVSTFIPEGPAASGQDFCNPSQHPWAPGRMPSQCDRLVVIQLLRERTSYHPFCGRLAGLTLFTWSNTSPSPLSSASGGPPRGQLVHLWSTSYTAYLLCQWVFLLCFIFMRLTRQVQAVRASDQTPITFEVGRTKTCWSSSWSCLFLHKVLWKNGHWYKFS